MVVMVMVVVVGRGRVSVVPEDEEGGWVWWADGISRVLGTRGFTHQRPKSLTAAHSPE